MFDLIKQSLYLGLGAASLTREKLMEFGKEITSRAQLTKEQAQQFEEDLIKKGEQARVDLQAEIDRRIDHAFIQLGIIKSNMTQAGEQATLDMGVAIEDRWNQALNRAGLARTSDVEALMARVELLEKKLAETQK